MSHKGSGLMVHAISLDELPVTPETPFLQQPFWGSYKSGFGWQARAFRIECPGLHTEAGLLVLERRLGWGLNLVYVPHGPNHDFITGIAASRGTEVGKVLSELAKCLASRMTVRPVCVRFDLDWQLGRRSSIMRTAEIADSSTDVLDNEAFDIVSENPRDALSLLPLHRARADVQPPDTVLIDLALGPQAILSNMKPKTRYNIRLAEKKGVTVAVANLSALPDWYRIYVETAERDRIAVHSQDYYQALLQQNPERTELLLAHHDGELLAGIIMLYTGERATYLYGASTSNKRNLMPAYLLQWTAMQRAIARDCLTYDCFGIPPSADPKHPMHGLYQFKTGFGGDVVNYAGCWDAPTRKILYRLYGTAEILRQFWFKKLKKR